MKASEHELAARARAVAESWAAEVVARQRAHDDRALAVFSLLFAAPVTAVAAAVGFAGHAYWVGAAFAVLGVLIATVSVIGITTGVQR